MAVVDTKTSSITAEDTAGRVTASGGKSLVHFNGQVESVSGDSIASTYRLVRVPSNLVITRLRMAWDALGGSAAADLGVYQVAANGGAVVDADEFASAVSLVSAGAWTDELEEAAAADIAKIGQPLWQRIGLTADPGRGYDIVATLTAASAGAATVALTVEGYYV